MKITNKKMFIRGIILLILAVAIAISRFFVFVEATHGILKAVIVIAICLLASIYHFVMAVHVDGEEQE